MIGEKLGNRYEVVRELGRGGMGVVYLARDVLLERDVAVKLIGGRGLSPEARARFLREARVVAKMDHPGVVAVHDIGEHDDGLYLVMALISGSNLREVLERGGPLRVDQAVDVAIQASDALEHAHALGIVHRDIKPENIMVVRKPDGGMRVLLADFGLATALTEQRLTQSGAVMGTVAYMSPEQVSSRAADARTDVYALGTVLYECVAGDVPFPGGDIASILYRVAHQPPLRLRIVAPGIDPELEELIMQCLQKDPAARPQRPRDLADALQRYRSTMRTADVVAPPRARVGAGSSLPMQQEPTVLAPVAESSRASRSSVAGRAWIGAGVGVGAVAALAALLLQREAARSHAPSQAPAPVAADAAMSASAAEPSGHMHGVVAASGPTPAPVSASAPTACDRYCDVVMKNCTGANAEYLSREICMKMCPAFEIGVTTADTGSPTLGCRMIHAAAAETAPGEHCRAAGPLGGKRCGKDPCAPFCALAVTYCVPPKAPPYPGGVAECQAACKNYPYLVADAGDTTFESGNTLNCRLWHLETAYTSDDFGLFHCSHTKRVSSTCF
jgi:hypothetical protein